MQKINAVFPSPPDHARGGVGALRRAIGAMATDGTDARTVPFGIAPLDGALGGGLPCGMLHEVAAAREAEMAAATGFALALAGRLGRRPVLWISEDMALKESGAPYGPGLDDLGLSPERLVTVAAAKSRDV